MRPFYELQRSDVGQPTIRAFGRTWIVVAFLGRVLPGDVGKRVYLQPGITGAQDAVLQVENDGQRAARLRNLH